MAIHDAYARLTPYELLFPEPEFPGQRFPAVADEALGRGVDTGNPAAFVMLGCVQGMLAELRGEDAGPEAAHDHGGALYFAYHMWRTDGAVALARQETLRRLLAAPADEASGGDGAWTAALSGRAGYIQLPQHLVWLEEEVPESVDGLFWHGDDHGALHLALVAGMRRERPGYLFVPVPPQPLGALPGWASGPAREDGRDFATSLPGADLERLLEVRTPAEVFKLAALLLRHLSRDGLAPRAPTPAAPGSASAPAPTPRPTTLPWQPLRAPP